MTCSTELVQALVREQFEELGQRFTEAPGRALPHLPEADLYAEEDYMREVEQGLEQHLKDRPVLLMYGENDAAQRAGFMSHVEEIFPRHRSVLIKGEQHFPHEGAPDEMIAAIMDWWPGDGPEQARG